MIEIWQRQVGESEKAFQAFALYRDLRDDRSFQAVSEKVGKNRKLIERWAKQQNWTDRVMAFDRDEDSQITKIQQEAFRKMFDKHIDLAAACLTKAELALQEITPSDLSGRDIVAMIKMGIEVEERSRILKNPDIINPEKDEQQTIKYIEIREQHRKPENMEGEF
jgi:hypothetical protein